MSDALRDALEMIKIRRDGISKIYFSLYFNERAGIMEFDGLTSRDEAEKRAHREALIEFKRIFSWLSNRSAEQLLEEFKSVPGE